jgi:myo-inositol-1(or 4)-monophosphatase
MTLRSALMTVMTGAAQKAARALKRDFGEVEQLQVSRKGPSDFVTAADLKAEKTLMQELNKARPKFGFLVEESGEIKGEDPRHRWIIDPIDGTTNFLHGIPHFAMSIALEMDGEIIAGLIYNPVVEEMYIAEKGKGAFLNDRRIRVSARSNLLDSVIATGIPHHGRG